MNTRSIFTVALFLAVAFSSGCKSETDAPFHMSSSGGKATLPGQGGAGAGSGMHVGGGAAGAPVWEPENGVCAGFSCGANQVCVLADEHATCQCRSGFAGPDCTDINECSTANICGQGSSCTNYQGTFSCECGEGRSRSVAGCVDTNECSSGISACDTDATCSNSQGSHVCTCEPGLFGDGSFCKAADSCAGAPCGDGTCRNTPSGFACECKPGSSGVQCENSCDLDAPIYFASDVLRQAVRSLVAVSGDITPRMLAPLTELYVPPPDVQLNTDDEIKTLQGLECWPSLRVLDLRGHGVTELAAVASLGALETLNLSCNRAADLGALSRLSRLQDLNLSKGPLCSDNERLENDFSFIKDLTSLRYLDASFFALSENANSFSQLKRLKFLNLRGNELSDIDGLAALLQLEELNLAQNPLAELGALAKMVQLKRLNLALTGGVDWKLTATLKQIEELDLSANSLSSIKGMEKNSALRVLRLSGNALVDLSPLNKLEHLLVLDVSGNQLSSIMPLAENLGFSGGQLWLGDNPIDCVSSASGFRTLQSRGVQVFGACSE